MLRGLTSLQAFVDDIAEGERWYSEMLGSKPYFRSEDAGLPAGHVGFRVGDNQSELGVTDRKLAPEGLPAGPAAPVAYWHVDDVAAAFDSVSRSQSGPRYLASTRAGPARLVRRAQEHVTGWWKARWHTDGWLSSWGRRPPVRTETCHRRGSRLAEIPQHHDAAPPTVPLQGIPSLLLRLRIPDEDRIRNR
jgi:catechol 2,3-dioxygenase-like lactoylglutathione lyase family enzyme